MMSVGHAVFLGDLGLERHAFLAHEAADGFQKLVAGFDVERHGGLPRFGETNPTEQDVQAPEGRGQSGALGT